MGKILIGTCSWTDPTLIGCRRFYPDSARSAEARLAHYASRFPLVEVDSAYYALPAAPTSGLWVKRTPPGFIFDIKAFRLFTQHPTPPAALPGDIREALAANLKARSYLYCRDLPPALLAEVWRRFEQALLPLDSAGKLGVVLFQFPPWFQAGSRERDYLLRCRESLPQYRLAVEFRHISWAAPDNLADTLGFLREHGLALVAVDEPQGFSASLPPVTEATADIGVIRFHGRNRDNWTKPGVPVSERFNYLYSEAELKEWLPRVSVLAAGTRELHVLFNNCREDKAVVNASQFRLMLD